jgi:YebC/PmpR family DNA-binding regulatory protein
LSGHSKWSTIKRKKGKADAERGKIFSRLSREITVAAREGGGDSEANPRLRTAIQAARQENMPARNIDNAVKKGTGEIPGVSYEESTYEAYGPGGAALLIEALTDNRNRSTAEIRHLLTKHGGSMGEVGSVAWIFHTKGFLAVEGGAVDEDTLLEAALEAGAEDVVTEDGQYSIYTPPEALENVRSALEGKGIRTLVAEVSKIPQNTVALEGDVAKKFLRLLESLEDHEDVQKVFSNFEVPDEILAEAGRV